METIDFIEDVVAGCKRVKEPSEKNIAQSDIDN